MAGTSAGARKGWETRWEAAYYEGRSVGPKGAAYIDKTFGPEIGGEPEYEDDWPDVWDFYDDETGDCG